MPGNVPDVMRPPVNRAMRVLDRTFFHKSVPISAARILSKKHIAECRKDLQRSKDVLGWDVRLPLIAPDPAPELAKEGGKCILLRDSVISSDVSTWSETIQNLVDHQKVAVIPYTIKLDYDSWDYNQIVTAILPEDAEEIPSGFSIVGHVAHLNLRDRYIPFKNIVAEIIFDKSPKIKTVINKVDNVGDESEFRTFQYELLAGEDDLNVVVSEEGCEFRFNYAKVYWNSRLQTEHRRMVGLFKKGEAVCDVMAGIGPFAVPAGKKGIFVWANDLNPESFSCLDDAITRNKVSKFVRAFNEDGHQFIKDATSNLWRTQYSAKVPLKAKPEAVEKNHLPRRSRPKTRPGFETVQQPRIFSHFVMNLPAIATTFLPSFIGLYSSVAGLPQDSPLPWIHVYCFSTKSDDNVAESHEICAELSTQLKHEFHLGPPGDLAALGSDEVWIHDVRDVAPKKRMFCASFRLPKEVAWR